MLHYLSKERTITGIDVPYRLAQTMPMLTQQQRIDHIKTLMSTGELAVSIRLFGLLFLLYGTPIGKLCMLTLDDVHTDPTGTAIRLGAQPAPLPDVFVPLLLAHLDELDRRTATNVDTNWLFPGTRAGRPRAPYTILPKLRQIGIEIQGARNTTLRTLVEELDPTSLSRMIGYSAITLDRHGNAATVPWSSYVTDKHPHLRKPHA
ncbi:hypothetical protein [Curtobacterium sp. MCBD17_003]|uniref:hypothetical protein n=1 Tax=Curtobacterium sp. MCBD17_003 TaxID=2175667 RepID=UPI0011B3654B|nr:hypothetical protein [Curtobacterium sp. MCBD17_003]WIE53188.1 hypothetical protein DEI88_008380 [Curtobacterium sp. MCBD17_003]